MPMTAYLPARSKRYMRGRYGGRGTYLRVHAEWAKKRSITCPFTSHLAINHVQQPAKVENIKVFLDKEKRKQKRR